jgi:hypothetical protein
LDFEIVVEGGGFEPPKAEPADLQSAPFDRSGTPPKSGAHYPPYLIRCQPENVIFFDPSVDFFMSHYFSMSYMTA